MLLGNEKARDELAKFIDYKEKTLKYCPFCGSSALIENTHTPSYWISCTDCGAEVHAIHEQYEDTITGHKKSIVAAVKSWNQRF